MEKNRGIALFETMIISVSVFLFLWGCASRPKQPESLLGSPEHHTLSGFKLIKKERSDDALREFKLALEYDPKNASAQRGLALAYGMKNNFKPAFESMSLARDYSKTKMEKAMAYVGFMRLHTMKRGDGWLEEVEKNFFSARSIEENLPEAYFYMGIAYKYGHRFKDSMRALTKVLEINDALVRDAGEQIEILQKIEKAMPESELGRRVAVQDYVTRADVAALLIQELRLDRIPDH